MNESAGAGEQIQDLILLIGHNPMPNYLVTTLLCPDHIHCLYTEETKPIYLQLHDVLLAEMPAMQMTPYYLHDAVDPIKIQESMAQMPMGAHLNYTGGTKAMTVNAYNYWREYLNGDESRASYFDGHRGILYCNDGNRIPLGECTVGIKQLLELHGLEKDPELVYHPDADIKPDDATKLMNAVLDKQGLSTKLNKTFHRLRNYKRRDMKGYRPSCEFIPTHARPEFLSHPGWSTKWGNKETTKGVAESWGRFLTGGWFEDIIERVASAACPDNATLAAGLRAKRGYQTELDLLILIGYRTYLISCTTSLYPDVVKGKCYEARNRVELVGGDLAQAAVVCLLPPDKAVEIEEKVRVPWQAAGTAVRVFGLGHVRSWWKGDHSTLTDWLSQT